VIEVHRLLEKALVVGVSLDRRGELPDRGQLGLAGLALAVDWDGLDPVRWTG
jgi:hypothetical protein